MFIVLSFTTFWPLLLLAAIPYLWWVRSRSLTDLSGDHLKVSMIVRSVTIGCLALALTQPVWNRTGSWISVVYLLDVSQSVAPASLTGTIDWIDQTNRTGDPAASRFIPFAASPQVFSTIDGLRGVQVSDTAAEGVIDQSATNLEAAIDAAIGSFEPHHLKRLVVATDGNENDGAVARSIRRLEAEGVRVFTRPMAARQGPDAWIDDVRTPGRITSEELFPLEVLVYSQSATVGGIELRIGDELLDSRPVELVAGINRVAFETRVAETGPVNMQVALNIPGDPVLSNNAFVESLGIAGRPRILYVEGRSESAHYLQNVLEQEGIEVELGQAGSIPNTVDGFDQYEAVILSDVRADALDDAQMEALATYVGDLGGGFILAGGDAVFGEDGYSETRVEEILPVRFDLEREPPTVALIIVLDKSGSMGGSKLELAKEASKAAVDVLRDEHLIGLVAFDYNHYWPVRLQEASQRAEINASISTIVAGGETNIYPALREAHLELQNVDSEIKHVILLSDGRSLPDDFATLVEEMADADETVSTVAVGNGADRELLNQIATWGNGRDYFIEDAAMVPQIFTEETELATQGTLSEQPFQVIVVKDVEALNGILFEDSPPLLGYVSTLAKDTAEVLLESDEDEAKPVLARWQYGLGKTVAFTSDVKDRWAAEWLAWEGYAQFWPQLVRETMRRNDNGRADLVVEKKGRNANVSVTALEEDGSFINDLDAELTIVGPSGTAETLALHQAGPGSYEATYPMETEGTYVFRLTGDDGGESRVLPYSYPEEHRFYPPDEELLGLLAASTGGQFNPTAEAIFRIDDETVDRPTPLWPYLAFVALLLYLTDLLLRRVRLFEPEF